MRFPLRFFLFSLLIPVGMQADDTDSALTIAEKALPWIQEEGQWWIEKKECVSCHHTSFGIWVGTLAKKHNLPFSDDLLTEWREWAWNHQLSLKEKKKPDEADEQIGERNIEGVSQLLLNGSEPLSKEASTRFQEIISVGQEEAGFWSPNGQLPRQVRPPEETKAISTMWAMLASTDKVTVKKGREWLAANREELKPETTEFFVMKALIDPGPDSFAQVNKRQNEDDGWRWADGEESDPIATGQALTAIGRLNKQSAVSLEIERAVDFLKNTQDEMGIWKTFSTKDRAEQTRISNFWGTTWAVIGLLESR